MYEEELQLAIEAAKRAGEFLKNNTEIMVESFEKKDIKLSADKESEAIILEILSGMEIPILSEECGLDEKAVSDKLWIIDPLDGTANYWKGMRELTCISIALWIRGEPALGIINRFQADELYTGVVGEGAYLNGKPIRTSETVRVKDAVLATGFPVFGDYTEKKLKSYVSWIQNFKKIRMLGAAAVMGAFVSNAKIDVYMEEEIMLWDIAASSAIVKAAGGCIEVERTEDYKCICRLFANSALRADYMKLL